VLISIGDGDEPEALVLVARIRARTINLTVGLADELAGQMALRRERVRFAIAADGSPIEAGHVVVIDDFQLRIIEVSDGKMIAFEAGRALTPALPVSSLGAFLSPEPVAVIVDAPACLVKRMTCGRSRLRLRIRGRELSR